MLAHEQKKRIQMLKLNSYTCVTSLTLVPLHCHHALQWDEHHSKDGSV